MRVGRRLIAVLQGIFQIKYLYAEHVYEWGAEQVCKTRVLHNRGLIASIFQLSYYITFMGAVRCIHLLFIMPRECRASAAY